MPKTKERKKEMVLKGRDILSNDLKVAVEIYKSEHEEKPTYFSELAKRMEGDVSRMSISNSVDKLFDLGMINAKWEKRNGRWVRQFYISGEAEEFIRALYERFK